MPSADHRVAIPAGDRQYHIGLAPGELADYILLPGDPDRTARIASRFDSIELEHRHREFAIARPARTAACGCRSCRPGSGPTTWRSCVAEILAITRAADVHPDRVVRGAPARDGAWRPGHLDRRRPARDHHPLVRPRRLPGRRGLRGGRRARRGGESLGHRHHLGITATAPGFFGAQGRPIPQLPIRYPDLADEMARQGMLNFEMEASALLVLAGLGRLPCRRRVRRVREPDDRRVRRRRRQGPGGSRRGGDGAREPPDPRASWTARKRRPGRSTGARRSGPTHERQTSTHADTGRMLP